MINAGIFIRDAKRGAGGRVLCQFSVFLLVMVSGVLCTGSCLVETSLAQSGWGNVFEQTR